MSAGRVTVQALRTLRAEIENDLAAINRVAEQCLAIFAAHSSSTIPPSPQGKASQDKKLAFFMCIIYTIPREV